MSNANIPFLDLVAPHKELKDELMAVCSQAFDTGGFIGGLIHGLLGTHPISDAVGIGALGAASAISSPSSIPPASLRDLVDS